MFRICKRTGYLSTIKYTDLVAISKQPVPTHSEKQSRADELLGEPCANPRYGGLTLREAVRKVVLRKNESMADYHAREAEKS